MFLFSWAGNIRMPDCRNNLIIYCGRQAEKTVNTTFHVLAYDDKTGRIIKGVTHQGNTDNSVWARGQVWAIYGFTMAYRGTSNKIFTNCAVNAANI
jgi:unsaturated chondroitin disaccharide hydrolase